MIDWIIKDFPLPPSVNKAFMPVMGKIKWNKGKPKAEGRLVKTEEHRDYESDCMIWKLSHMKGVEILMAEILKRTRELKAESKNLVLKLEMFAVFDRSKIFTQKNNIAALDGDNRCKLAQDKLFNILMLDDKHVFKNEIQKIPGSKDYMIIRISEYEIKDEEHIKKQLGIS